MKKILASILILIFLLLITFLIILSTVGIETKRFNSLISNKINEVNNNIDLNLNEIKFKLDIKKIKLFLQTKNPKVVYRNVSIPVEEIQVFVVFKSILTSEPQIEKINLVLKQLDINELKIISKNFKPSNLNSFLNNNIIEGSLNCEINIFLDRKNIVQNFIVKGSAINFKTKLVDNLFLNNLKFDFFADKNDILFKNIFGENDFIKVSEGDLKIILSSKFQLNGNFQSQFNYDSQKKNEISILENIKYFKNIIALEANLNNSFLIDFDETYKIVNYEYKNQGKITKSIFNLNEPVKDILSNDEINKFSFFNTEISSNFNLNRKQITLFGKYSLHNGRPVVFNSDSQVEKGSTNLKIDFEYINPINFDLINYKKPNDKIAKIFLNLEKKKNIILVNEINYKDSNNVIFLKDLKLNNNRFESLKNASVKTLSDGKINNDFQIIYNDEIKIKEVNLMPLIY